MKCRVIVDSILTCLSISISALNRVVDGIAVSSLQSSSIKQIVVSIILHRFVAINNIMEVNQLSFKKFNARDVRG